MTDTTHMPRRPIDLTRRFLALDPLWQIAIAAALRVASILMFDMTGAVLKKSVWISGFYYPAGFIVYFAFAGSIWAVAGVAAGTFIYTRIFRDIPWPLDLMVAIPSAAALLITMLFYSEMVEKRRTPLADHVSIAQIVVVVAIYSFWNYLFHFLVFSIFNEQLNTYFLLTFFDMVVMFAGDFLGAFAVLTAGKLLFRSKG